MGKELGIGPHAIPDPGPLLSDKAKYGVFVSQLHWFAANCSSLPKCGSNTKRLLGEMVLHGYAYARLRTLLWKFWCRYDAVQRRVYQLSGAVSSRKRWSQLVKACDRLERGRRRRGTWG